MPVGPLFTMPPTAPTAMDMQAEAMATQVPSTPGGSGHGYRGGDSTLAKACPDIANLTKAGFRQMRVRLLTFRSMARRRGTEAEADAAYLLLNQIQEHHFWLAESMDYERLENEEPFKVVMDLLDTGFKYAPEIEIPSRCVNFFHSFFRNKDEMLERYVVRHATELKLLEDLGCQLPEQLRLWHFLSRGGFPEQTWPAIRGLMGADHTLSKAVKAVQKMFGAESHPDVKELEKLRKTLVQKIEGGGRKSEVYYEADDEEDDAWWTYDGDYNYDDWDDSWWANEDEEEDYAYEAYEDGGEDVPQELEQMADQTDELLVTWLESRKKMAEYAKSRGFYPVMAIPPEATSSFSGGGGKSYGKGKGKGKRGKSKGKKGKVNRPFPKGSFGAGKGKQSPFPPRSTTSGSTQQHGPRFKRMRDGRMGLENADVNFIEEVFEVVDDVKMEVDEHYFPEENFGMFGMEETLMVEETEFSNMTVESEVNLVENGKVRGVCDGGCTTTVCGKEIWKTFLEQRQKIGDYDAVLYSRCNRTFRFGNGEVLKATVKAQLRVWILGRRKHIEVHLVPGGTPFLISRACMEEWKIMIDYSTKTMCFVDDEATGWVEVERSNKGHYLFDILGENGREEALLQEEENVQKKNKKDDSSSSEESADGEDETGSEQNSERLTTDDVEKIYYMTVVSRDGLQGTDEAPVAYVKKILAAVEDVHYAVQDEMVKNKRSKKKPRLIFEVFVDEGNLGLKCAEYDDVQVFQFSIQNGWDFRKRRLRQEFMDWVRRMRPDEIFMAPPCGPWCRWQSVNKAMVKGFSQRLERMRKASRANFLAFCRQVYLEQYKNGRNCTIEQPWTAESWGTPEFRDLPGYAVDIDQCAYGAVARDSAGGVLGPCQKRTRLQTTKKLMAERMNKKCQCSEKHCTVRGVHAKRLQNYPPALVNEIAKVMKMEEGVSGLADMCVCEDEEDQGQKPEDYVKEIMETMVVEEAEEEDEKDEAIREHLKELRRKYGVNVVRSVLKIHKMLGHPSPGALAQYLQQAQCEAEWITCARELKCSFCQERSRPKAVRIARVPSANSFNDQISIDVFHVQHKGETRKILTIQDDYSKYVVDVALKSESAKSETKALDKYWLRPFGPPRELRLDSYGAHMSEAMAKWAQANGIKLRLIPKGGHHMLGALERDHQVRREQLGLYSRIFPEDSLKKSLLITSAQRNRYRLVGGYSPATLALGYQPRDPGEGDNQNLAEMASHEDVQSKANQDRRRRSVAAQAFIAANASRAVRATLLARTRPERKEYQTGEWVYYWRRDPGASITVKTHWKGPAMVCCSEPRVEQSPGDEREVVIPTVYWIAHGSALMRCTAENLRPEFPEEEDQRVRDANEDPEDGHRAAVQRIRDTIENAQGPIRYHDMAEAGDGGPPAEARDYEDDVDADGVDAEVGRLFEEVDRFDAERQQRDAQEQERVRNEMMAMDMLSRRGMRSIPMPAPRPEEQERVPETPMPGAANDPDVEETNPGGEASASNPGISTRHDHLLQQAEEAMRKRNEEQLGASEAEPSSKRQRYENRNIEDMMSEDETMMVDDVVEFPEMELLLAEEDEVFMMKNANTLVWARLSDEEKVQFNAAKDEALKPWIENNAFEGVDSSVPEAGQLCPLKYLLKWKVKDGKKKANARVILQGFKHRDVLSGEIAKESPTLSRLGRMVIFMISAMKHWPLWLGDVKSAFLQSEDIRSEGVHLYGKPPIDMEHRLVRLQVMKTGQVLLMKKPAFGDVRAPKLWNNRITTSMKAKGWLQHALDPCLFLSFRKFREGDDEHEAFEKDGEYYTLDGIAGLHVDDFLGCGEGVKGKEDVISQRKVKKVDNYQSRVRALAEEFTFGSWSFAADHETQAMTYCGAEVWQDMRNYDVYISHETYLHKVKPITISKERRATPQEECSPKETHQLRAGIGALAWPAHQTSPHLCASLSLMQANVGKARVENLLEYNKTLSFAKSNADVKLKMSGSMGKSMKEIRLGLYFDAAWAVRPNGDSQGGYLIFVIKAEDEASGKPTELNILDYGSKKLPRKARSSLTAEVQAGSLGVDQLEWTKVFVTKIFKPWWSSTTCDTARWTGNSPVITDAKSLYDATRSPAAGLSLTEKRTSLELSAVNDRVIFFDGDWQWTSAFQQLADGLTKGRARQAFAEALRRGTHALRFSEECVAGKKISPEKKKEMIDELDKKKADLEGENGDGEDEQKKKKQKKPSSWKSWGAPAINKAVAAATMFAEVEGSQEDQQMESTDVVNEEIFGWELWLVTILCLLVATWWWMRRSSRSTSTTTTQTDEVTIVPENAQSQGVRFEEMNRQLQEQLRGKDAALQEIQDKLDDKTLENRNNVNVLNMYKRDRDDFRQQMNSWARKAREKEETIEHMQARMVQLEARNEVLEGQMLERANRSGAPEVVYCSIGGECYHVEGCQHARVGKAFRACTKCVSLYRVQ